MFEWKKIRSIEDEEVLKFLGQHMFAFRHEGYFVTHNNYDLYVLVVGNGTVIKIHNCSYVVAIIKNNSMNMNLLNENHKNHIIMYSIKDIHGNIEERHWIEKYKEIVERDFK